MNIPSCLAFVTAVKKRKKNRGKKKAGSSKMNPAKLPSSDLSDASSNWKSLLQELPKTDPKKSNVALKKKQKTVWKPLKVFQRRFVKLTKLSYMHSHLSFLFRIATKPKRLRGLDRNLAGWSQRLRRRRQRKSHLQTFGLTTWTRSC